MTTGATERAGLIERLREPLTPDGYERLLKGWDAIRHACGESEGSLPRDMFEALIDGLLQDMEEAATTLERAQAHLIAATEASEQFERAFFAEQAQVEVMRRAVEIAAQLAEQIQHGNATPFGAAKLIADNSRAALLRGVPSSQLGV